MFRMRMHTLVNHSIYHDKIVQTEDIRMVQMANDKLTEIHNQDIKARIVIHTRYLVLQGRDRTHKHRQMDLKTSQEDSHCFQKVHSRHQQASCFVQMDSIKRTTRAFQKQISAISLRRKPIFTWMKHLQTHSMIYQIKDTQL